jgi:hypothetical protein
MEENTSPTVSPEESADSNAIATGAAEVVTPPAREASTVPELERDPKKSRFSLRKNPDDPTNYAKIEEKVKQHRKSRASIVKGKKGEGLRQDADPEANLLKLEILPGGDLGERIDVTGFGAAPRGKSIPQVP